MAVVDLHLIKLHRSLIVLYCALVLQNKFFLIIQDLLCNGVACPGGTVPFQVHLRLGEHVLVSLEGSLCLQKSCAVRTGIDVDQRVALPNQLTLLVVHGDDEAVDLAGNRIGIDRGHRADFVKIDADVTFRSGRGRNVDLRRRGRGFFLAFVVAPYQHHSKHEQEQQNSSYDDPPHSAPVRL